VNPYDYATGYWDTPCGNGKVWRCNGHEPKGRDTTGGGWEWRAYYDEDDPRERFGCEVSFSGAVFAVDDVLTGRRDRGQAMDR